MKVSGTEVGVDTLVCDTVVFDVIGTLVDEVGTITEATTRILGSHGIERGVATELAQRWLDAFDRTTRRIADGAQEWRDDGTLRHQLLTELLAEAGISLTSAEFTELSTVNCRLVAWPGAAEQLSRVAERVMVAALSNASIDQLAEISRQQGLRWHATLSTALVHTYKPDPATYRFAIDRLALDPQRSLFVAAHPWDLRGAAAQGFRTAYLPREHAEAPASDDRFDLALGSLDDLIGVLPAPRRGGT